MNKKWIYMIIAAVLVVAVAIAGTVYYFNPNNYVAKVGSEKVTKPEYQFFLTIVKQQMLSQAGKNAEDKDFWKSTKIEGKSAADVAKDRALENAKEFKIQLIKAKEGKIVLDKSDTDKINSSVDSMVQQAGSRDKANTQVTQTYGVNLDEFKSIYQEYMLVNKFAQAEAKKINISDDQAKKYYDADNNKDSLDKVTVKHVLISTLDKDKKPLPDDKKQEAKRKAEDILSKAKAGDDFAGLAKQFSEDPGSKDNGGEYTFGKGEMVPQFEGWAFDKSRKPGDLGIVETSYGYHVMKFEKKTTFDDVKETAKDKLRNDEYTKQLEGWKKDTKYDVIKNQKVLDSITVA